MHNLLSAAIGASWPITMMCLDHATGRPIAFYGWVIAWVEAHNERKAHRA